MTWADWYLISHGRVQRIQKHLDSCIGWSRPRHQSIFCQFSLPFIYVSSPKTTFHDQTWPDPASLRSSSEAAAEAVQKKPVLDSGFWTMMLQWDERSQTSRDLQFGLNHRHWSSQPSPRAEGYSEPRRTDLDLWQGGTGVWIPLKTHVCFLVTEKNNPWRCTFRLLT